MRLTRAAACRAIAASAASLTLLPKAFASAATPPATLLDLCAARSDLSTWCAVVKTAGLEGELTTAGPITVFAPSNAAFDKLPVERRDALLHDPEKAKALVLGLLVRDRVTIDAGDGGTISSGSIASASGANLVFGSDDGQTTVNGAKLERRDLKAGNGLLDVTAAVAA